jgi:putative endopeptidase
LPFRFRIIGFLLIVLAAWPLAAKAGGCAVPARAPEPASARQNGAAQSSGAAVHGLDLSNLDRSVSPCADFYRFADGDWIRSHPIPPDRSSWSQIDALQERNREILRQILEQDAAAGSQTPRGSNARELGDFYASCMNVPAAGAAGAKALAPEFRRIAGIRNLSGLEIELARLHQIGVGALFGFGATPDISTGAREIAQARPAGLGLPAREDYLQNDEHSRELREKYAAHIARMLGLAGDPAARASAEAQAVLRIETRLARASAAEFGQRDAQAAFHEMSLSSLQALTPHFSWSRYLQAAGAPAVGAVDVSQPAFFPAMDRGLSSIPLSDWKIYLRWQLLHAFAPDLSAAFANENFDFYGRTLAGSAKMPPRWQFCVGAADRELREPLGREFVARSFSPSDKKAVLGLVRDLIAAFRRDLQGPYWMSPSARKAAIAKLDAMTIQVGYPDRWPDDSADLTAAGSFVERMIGANRRRFRLDLARIGQPIDSSLWPISTSAVQAFYDPATNAIFLPAGILQPPFFDPVAGDALNYGGVGAAIGHELTHAFDGEGSRFDARGRLKNWWTAEDRENFQGLANCVADQYDTYFAADDIRENGPLVQDESLADIGGLAIAYQAFQKTAQFHSRRKLQGFTSRQRFFLAYARMWAENNDPAYIRLMAISNPHALGRFRVIGPLSDFEPFAQAFRCRGNEAMVRPVPDRCAIW